MRYLCLGFHEESAWAALPPAQRDGLVRESLDYEEQLRQNGHLIRSTALQSARNATTLRFSPGDVAITDGPFAETKEQLGGIMLLEASDLNHAIALVSKMPCMRVGGLLEIRPVNEDLESQKSS